MGYHAHAQIEYESVESLIGFNPTAYEDRKFVHELLDEYLDYLAERYQNKDGEPRDGNGFRVFDLIHEE